MSVTDQSWRALRAEALEATAAALEDALEHVANVEAALALGGHGSTDLETCGREYAGRLRTVRNDLMHEARTLRAVTEG